ncbi:hypothetical protein MRY87_05395 [bacterium]|nr:hypothetical protein [bacterium]
MTPEVNRLGSHGGGSLVAPSAVPLFEGYRSEGPVIRAAPESYSVGYHSAPSESLSSRIYGAASSGMEALESGSAYVLDRFSDLGGWWKEQKSSLNLSSIDVVAGATTAPDEIFTEYLPAVAKKIDGKSVLFSATDSAKIDVSRVPKALDYRTPFSQAVSKVGAVGNSVLGVLDLAEAVHDEGGKPGKKTILTASKSVLQGVAASAAGYGVASLAAMGGGMLLGAPLFAGAAAVAATGYGVGLAFDWMLGE